MDQLEEDRFCANCKHLVGIRWKTEAVENWGCGHPENTCWEKTNLVTGLKKRIFIRSLAMLRYPTEELLADVRVTLCGPEGKWYEEYKEPDYGKAEEPVAEKDTIGAGRKSGKFSLDI